MWWWRFEICSLTHSRACRGYPRVSDALRKLDIEAVLFFLGENCMRERLRALQHIAAISTMHLRRMLHALALARPGEHAGHVGRRRFYLA
jgi:hypothetical protein